MEKDREDFFHSVYMKWVENTIKPEDNAINHDIIQVYCEFLKDYIEFNDIDDYCKTVGENDYTISELKTIWNRIGNVYQIKINVTIPAKFESEAKERIESLLKSHEIEYKIEKCELYKN
jgi:hypothetical protein